MSFESLRSRFRNLRLRRLGQARAARERMAGTPAGTPDAAPLPEAPTSSTPVTPVPIAKEEEGAPALPQVASVAPAAAVVPSRQAPSTPASADLAPPFVAPEIVSVLAPGRFETDAELGLRPKLYDLPNKRREFIVYVPAGWSPDVRAPLIVLCHGCKQTPEEFAKGSRIAAFADRHGALVLLPRQTRLANPWRCWSWFDPVTMNGGGEAEIVAAQIRFVRLRYHADPRRVVAVGISAGAALAAVLGLRFPRQVRAVIAHSGVACGAANSAMAATDVMMRGPNADVVAIGVEARANAGTPPSVPLLAIHGEGDPVIAPANSIALVRQFLHFNGHPAAAGEDGSAELPAADQAVTTRTPDGREVTTRDWLVGRRLAVRHVSIAGLGHAWSGGDAAVAFNDGRGPDATQLVGDFLADVLPPPARTQR